VEHRPHGGPAQQGVVDVGCSFRSYEDHARVSVAFDSFFYGFGGRATHNADQPIFTFLELPGDETCLGGCFFKAEYFASAREQHRPGLEPPGEIRQGAGQPSQDRFHGTHAFSFRLVTGRLTAL